MGVAYSQTRSIARARIARNDVSAQVAELFEVENTSSVALDECDPYMAELAAWQEHCAAEDQKYFDEHGEWPNWAFLAWLDKEAEREECARWEAENPTLS